MVIVEACVSPPPPAVLEESVSHHRAEGLVRIARRAGASPECFALFQAGILEDAMVRMACGFPPNRTSAMIFRRPC